MKERRLQDLLEPCFAEGYDQFREIVEWGADLSALPADQRAWARLFELVSVAAIEGLNEVESRFELPPHEAVIVLWHVVGAVLATVNAQAYRTEGKLVVRREMLKSIKEGYDRTIKSVTEDAPREQPAL